MAQRLESVLYGAFLAALVWAPIPFASNRPWAAALLSGWIGLVLLSWLMLFAGRRVRLNSDVWHLGRWPLLLLCLVQLWILLQMLPLPRDWLAQLSPRAALWHPGSRAAPLSLDVHATGFYLLKGLTVTAGFFLTLALVSSGQRLRRLLQVLVFAGTCQALYGSLMVLSGLELGFFVEKYASLGSATGTFVNRNHLAGFLVMCLSAGIGLLLSQLALDRAHNLRDLLRRALELLLSPKIRLRIYLAIMVVALVLTRSRMGNISFFLALTAAGAVALATGRHFSARLALFLLSLFVVDVLILGQWFGFDRLSRRLQDLEIATEQRVWSNEYTLDMIADFPLTGSGGGSFYSVFPNYQAPALTGYHAHAHNDYLQFAAELGVPVVLLLGSFLGFALWHACWVQRHRNTPLYRGAGFAVVMTASWALVHSTTDFNLQMPANALIFVTLLALAPISRVLPAGKAG